MTQKAIRVLTPAVWQVVAEPLPARLASCWSLPHQAERRVVMLRSLRRALSMVTPQAMKQATNGSVKDAQSCGLYQTDSVGRRRQFRSRYQNHQTRRD